MKMLRTLDIMYLNGYINLLREKLIGALLLKLNLLA